MKYLAKGKTLEDAVRNTFRPALEKKYVSESATISAGRNYYNTERFSFDVTRGQRITVSWDAHDPTDGDYYAIDINSNFGDHQDSFSSSGQWSTSAHYDGEMDLSVGVSYTPGYFIFAPRVTITVNG